MGSESAPLHYVSQARLARRYKVSSTNVANWRARYPVHGEWHPTPAPDGYVDGRELWLESTVPAWDAWVQSHPNVLATVPVDAEEKTLPPPEYLTKTDLARALDVHEQTVHSWVRRLANDKNLPTPAPSLVVGTKPYWHRDRVPEWEAWRKAHNERVVEQATKRAFDLGKRPYAGERGPRLDTKREHIRAVLEQRIREGIYLPGTPIPSSRALAEEFGVQDMTANRAAKQLKEQGLVVRVGMRLVVCESEQEGDT